MTPGPRRFLAIVVPWALLIAMLLWQWRVALFTEVPAYSDVLEILWTLDWVNTTLAHQHTIPFLSQAVFYPLDWHLGTASFGSGALPLLLALQGIGGPAFAFNSANLLGQFAAFAGSLRLARRYIGFRGAVLAALMYVFWIGRWSRMSGHLNVLLATALMPWLALGLWHAFGLAPRRRWPAGAALVWAAMIWCSLYFIWIGGLMALCWATASVLGSRLAWRPALARLTVISLAALVFAAPLIAWFWLSTRSVGATLYSAEQMALLGAGINSLFIPSLYHPLLQGFIESNIYHAPIEETGLMNFGLLASVLALAGAWRTRRDRNWFPLIVLAASGLILMLGLYLKVDVRLVQLDLPARLNGFLWQLGHELKPTVFPSALLPPELTTAVPLPGMLLMIFVPFIEGARYFSRFGFVTGLAWFILAAFAVEQLRNRGVTVIVTALLLIELIPAKPQLGVPFPPVAHPAFLWVSQHSAAYDGFIDFYPDTPNSLIIVPGGEAAWEERIAGQPSLFGPGSIIPAHSQFLIDWLLAHPHPFQSAELPVLLRAYGARYIVLHMATSFADGAFAEAGRNKALRIVMCAAPLGTQTLWAYPICVIELLPGQSAGPLTAPEDGWALPEDWAIWTVGTESRLRWMARMRSDYHLTIAATPYCVAGQPQEAEISMGQQVLAAHRWSACEEWSASIEVPKDLVEPGWNEITIRRRYAWRPVDATFGQSADLRNLSLAFTHLDMRGDPAPGGH